MISMSFRTSRAALFVCAFGFAAASSALAQLRVANWNVTNYSAGRVSEFQTALYASFEGRSLAPDLLITQEFLSANAVTNFLAILNTAPGSPGDWAAFSFIDGPDTDSACFYRTTRLTPLGQTIIATGGPAPNHPRHVIRYDLRPAGYAADATVLACYSTHMKSGSASNDQARRLLEAQRIRADARSLNPLWNFLVAGDFNIQSSSQAAYQELVGVAGNPVGQFFDPIATPGSWNNNQSYRFVHTQDPIGAGGMDDRHDQILLSDSLLDEEGLDYIGNASLPYSNTTWDDPTHSYRVWGNDGTSFDQALRTVGNTMVGQTIAEALRATASGGGHLPVFLDLVVPAKVGSETSIDLGVVTAGATASATLHVRNAGDLALWSEAGIADLNYSFNSADAALTVPPGNFLDAATIGENAHEIIFEAVATGPYEGSLSIVSNDPDQPERVVTVTAQVVGPVLTGDLNCDGSVTVADIGPFVLAMTAPAAYESQFPNCDALAGDTNQDGLLTVADIGGFVLLLTGG